jgi:hypothetical protein
MAGGGWRVAGMPTCASFYLLYSATTFRFEYYFREVYYAGLINGTTDLFDPMGTGYDPDFLHRHHA